MNKELHKQIVESAGNVKYTYVAHWKIVNRLEKRYKRIKITQIVLTALASTGFIVSLTAGISWLSWVGGLTSAISLCFNLYMLNFNLPNEIKQHTDAANDLWEVREAYDSLITDYTALNDDAIRDRRDRLIQDVSRINKSYPETDSKSFDEAKKDMPKYTFGDGEAEQLLNRPNSSNDNR